MEYTRKMINKQIHKRVS